jgi:hypothetical protein
VKSGREVGDDLVRKLIEEAGYEAGSIQRK